MFSRSLIGIGLALITLAGCDLFSPRTPEPPITDAGTFTQPDEPRLVVENLEAAVEELNTQNYRRSLADGLVFEPTATALASDPVLADWSKDEEVSYFTTLAEAARLSEGHELRLMDVTEELAADRYLFEAGYLLIVHHHRPTVPDTVQGRLLWDIRQGLDGLWYLDRWTDQELGNSPAWSDLKAEFLK